MADALRHAANFDPSRWSRLKALFTGGAPNPPANIRWWLEQGVRMVDGYGMTETGTTLGMPLAADLLREKAGAVGLCGPLTSVRLVDENGQDVPDGTAGEILINQPTGEDLASHCRARLARYKIPKEFVLVADLPRTGSGKVMKHVLRRQALPA